MEYSAQNAADLSGPAVFVAGAAAVCGSYLFQYVYNITAERAVVFKRTPKFYSFGPDLKNFLSSQPNQEALILVEGSVEQYGDNPLTTFKGDRLTGAGKVVLTTEYFKTRVENTENTWRDTSRTTENVRVSIPFVLRDSTNSSIIVEAAHTAIGFDNLLQLVYQEHLTDKGKTAGDVVTGMMLQEIPTSIWNQEYLLIFGTKFAGYGRAALQDMGQVVKFYPEEVGSSIKSLIDSQELIARAFRWLSRVCFIGGIFMIVFVAAPLIWRFLHGRRSAHRSSLKSLTD